MTEKLNPQDLNKVSGGLVGQKSEFYDDVRIASDRACGLCSCALGDPDLTTAINKFQECLSYLKNGNHASAEESLNKALSRLRLVVSRHPEINESIKPYLSDLDAILNKIKNLNDKK